VRWKIKDPKNERCIISNCGAYRISKFTCGGVDLFLVYYGNQEIGDAGNGNQARRIADKHSKGAV